MLASDLNHAGGSKTDLILSICHAVGADAYLSGAGARAYLDVDKLKDNGVEVVWQQFQHPQYLNLYGHNTVHLRPAALDALLNIGPEATLKSLEKLRSVRSNSEK
jgi:hypothetical protein